MAAKSASKKSDFVNKTFVPVRSQKTAEQRKNEEIYGKTLSHHQPGKRLDGALMADAADWRNPHQTYTNSPSKLSLTQKFANAKERKFENLESNVVLGETDGEK